MTISIRKKFIHVLAGGAAAAFFLAPQMATAESTKLTITMGSWGYAADRKNVKDDIAKMCDGKSDCTFMVKNESLGLSDQTDPSPGNHKGLMIFWKCGDADHKDQFPEGKNAVLKCN